jgi:uncharacterized protein YcbK (DUF882 family)
MPVAGVTWVELPPARRRHGLDRGGFSPRQQRRFDVVIYIVVGLFAAAWMVAIVYAVQTGGPRPGVAAGMTTNPLAPGAPPPAAFLLDAALRRLVTDTDHAGESGQVHIIVHQPGDAPPLQPDAAEGVTVEYVGGEPGSGGAPDTIPAASGPPPPGVWNVLLRARDGVRRVPNLAVLSMVPLTEKRGGRIGSYVIGSWPQEAGGTPRSPEYAPPRGMVRVTPENLDLAVSRHFRLRHFVTKGQETVWPKYVLISPRLLDKLELTIDELNRSGVRVERVGVISGFRTPNYNAGGGDTSGRGALSRHMYGDAMDWFVDNDGDGRMDDLNGDGRVDVQDARVIAEAAERIERRHPHLVGGIGIYRPTGAHSGFVHLDTRGYRARW